MKTKIITSILIAFALFSCKQENKKTETEKSQNNQNYF